MNRNELITRLETSMMTLGKEMHNEQSHLNNYSPAQNHILMIVVSRGSIGVKQLAQTLRVTSGAATQHIGALEKAGLVTRSINPDSRREVVVEATSEGKEAIKSIHKAKSQVLNQMFTALDDQELSDLVGLVEKVSNKYGNV
jgi:MarR family transcriptional regulator, organic hydroperoxide resistance regulator